MKEILKKSQINFKIKMNGNHNLKIYLFANLELLLIVIMKIYHMMMIYFVLHYHTLMKIHQIKKGIIMKG